MIRLMSKEDLDQVLCIETSLFTSPWPKHEYEYELDKNPFSNLIVIEEDGKIIGYCDYWMIYEQAQIANIAIDSAYHRKGYAQALMDYVVNEVDKNHCENISLEVRVSNTPAISFYEKNGFITVNTRKDYYTDNHEDAYLMVKPLGGNYDIDSSN